MSSSIEALERNFHNLNCGPIEMLVKSNYRYARYFEGFAFRDLNNASSMLEDIMNWIKSNNLPKLYILVDEYDNFTNQLLTSFKDPLYENITTGDSFCVLSLRPSRRGSMKAVSVLASAQVCFPSRWTI